MALPVRNMSRHYPLPLCHADIGDIVPRHWQHDRLLQSRNSVINIQEQFGSFLPQRKSMMRGTARMRTAALDSEFSNFGSNPGALSEVDIHTARKSSEVRTRDTMDEAVRMLPRVIALDRRAVRRRFEQRFSSARMAKDYVAVYRSLLERPSISARETTVPTPRPVLEKKRMDMGRMVIEVAGLPKRVTFSN
jgi:hypothetical protein